MKSRILNLTVAALLFASPAFARWQTAIVESPDRLLNCLPSDVADGAKVASYPYAIVDNDVVTDLGVYFAITYQSCGPECDAALALCLAVAANGEY